MREESAGSSMALALRRSAANEENPKTELEHFFVSLKRMTVNGYYTSTIGIHQRDGVRRQHVPRCLSRMHSS